ncbi:hypothetical protein [Lacticaseibacillus hulanensis]|uniref:hypothetical protein n=1 Tax=Lacticaseibacillus hulanensis TaxID=2493111 RepID=UPI000FD8805C|nr:hypothetical protein [Lacticaseibacillus hulanensis]
MATHMGVYLTNSSNNTIELPVAPSDFTVPSELDGESVTVLGLGEINRIGLEKLKTISFDGVLPLIPKTAHYTTAQKLLKNAQAYIDWIQAAKKTKKPVRVVLSGTKISLSMQITSFEYGFKSGNSIEYQYTLGLTEYRQVQAHKVKVVITKPTTVKKGTSRPAPSKKIGVGSTVIVNGTLHRDSYGAGPGKTEHNATRKVSIYKPGRKCPYHVTTLSGGWRGWVTAGSVKLK